MFLSVHVAILGCHDRISGIAPGLLPCGGEEDMGSLG